MYLLLEVLEIPQKWLNPDDESFPLSHFLSGSLMFTFSNRSILIPIKCTNWVVKYHVTFRTTSADVITSMQWSKNETKWAQNPVKAAIIHKIHTCFQTAVVKIPAQTCESGNGLTLALLPLLFHKRSTFLNLPNIKSPQWNRQLSLMRLQKPVFLQVTQTGGWGADNVRGILGPCKLANFLCVSLVCFRAVTREKDAFSSHSHTHAQAGFNRCELCVWMNCCVWTAGGGSGDTSAPSPASVSVHPRSSLFNQPSSIRSQFKAFSIWLLLLFLFFLLYVDIFQRSQENSSMFLCLGITSRLGAPQLFDKMQEEKDGAVNPPKLSSSPPPVWSCSLSSGRLY